MTEGMQELSVAEERPRTLAEMKAQKFLIQEFLSGVMKDGVHYGTIPGTPKPTLFKAGAEVILSGLNLAVEPVILNLSTPDEAHYIVHVRIVTMKSKQFIGEGVGEASSNEMKYKWRSAVCDEEFEETPVDRRRELWKKGSPPYKVRQVRTEPADIANTVLKMAKKRAQIDATLTCTAASDIFAQDIEDLRDNGIDPADAPGDGHEEPAAPPVTQPRAKTAAAPSTQKAAAPAAGTNGTDFTGEIKFIGEKPITKKDGSQGKVHVITAGNGIKYETFSDTFADTCRTAFANKGAVHITAEKGQWGYKMKTCDPVMEAEA